MKTIYKTILGTAAFMAVGLGFTACSDFLETEPASQISESEYYTTEEEMMKGLYALMDEVQIRLMEVWSYSSLLSDESETGGGDRKSTRLNSSHANISYAVFCLKKKKSNKLFHHTRATPLM